MIYDVIIVGLGPSGATAACELKRRGLSVLGVDKAAFPRYKACGGGISPKVRRIVLFPLDEVIQSHTDTVRLSLFGNDEFVMRAQSPFCFMVMREDFDYLFLDRAKSAGATIMEKQKVTGICDQNGVIEVLTSGGSYRGRILIGADGAHSIVAKEKNLARKRRFYFTFTAELSVPTLGEHGTTSWIDIGTIPNGCAWIFPKREHVTLGIGMFSSHSKRIKDLQKYIYEYIEKYQILRGAKLKGGIRGHLIATLLDERSKIGKDNIFLIGEAAGLVDPFTGEGIYYAIRSAQILSRLLSEGKPSMEVQGAYHTAVREEFLKSFRIAEYIARFVYRFPSYSHRLLHQYRHLADYYRSILAGETSYKEIYKRMRRRIWTVFGEKGLLVR